MKKKILFVLTALISTFILASTTFVSYGCRDASNSSSGEYIDDDDGWTKPY